MSTRRLNRPMPGVFARTNEVETRRDPTSTRRHRVSALSARLEEALVFIIHQDGTKEYQRMTLRELYNYVLAAISVRPGKGVAHTEHGKSMKRASVAAAIPSVLEAKNPISQSLVSSLGASETDASTAAGEVVVIKGDEKIIEKVGEEKIIVHSEDEKGSKKVSFDTPDTPPRHGSDKDAGAAGTKGNVTYRDRLGGYLHPRDMRRLVTPFSTTNAPEIMVRRHVILLNCDPIRAIVLRDRLLVLVPDDSETILEILAKRIIGGREELEDDVFGDSPVTESGHSQQQSSEQGDKPKKFSSWSGHGKAKDANRSESNVSGATDVTVEEETDQSDEDSAADEWDDLQGRGWIDLPFELKAVDAVLHTVSIMLAEDVELLQEAVYDTIDEVLAKGRAVLGDHNQKVLRALKNAIKEMSSRVDNFVRAINESLDDLEDLSLMNLSRLLTHPELFIQPVPREVLEEESDEPELILEVYMQQALSTYNQLDLLKGQVTTSEELMAMQLDTVRNRLLLIDAVVSIAALSVSVAALVGSIYGMNVIIGVEDDPDAFTRIVVGTVIACVIFLMALLFIFYRALALPSIS